MAEIVNLRRARKAKARADATADAQTARARHGRTRAEKVCDAAEADQLNRTLDSARREREPDQS